MKRFFAIFILIALIAVPLCIGIFSKESDTAESVAAEASATVLQTDMAAITKAPASAVQEKASGSAGQKILPVSRFASTGAIFIYAFTGLLLLIIIIAYEKELARRVNIVREKLPYALRNCSAIRKARFKYRLKRLPALLIVLAIAAALLLLLPLGITQEEADLRNAEAAASASVQEKAKISDTAAAQEKAEISDTVTYTLKDVYMQVRNTVSDSSALLKNLWWLIPSALLSFLIMLRRKSAAGRVFWFLVLGALIIAPIISINKEWRTVNDRVFEEANLYYTASEWQNAADCYEGILLQAGSGVRGAGLKHYADTEVKNNYALALLQLGRNEEALTIMKGICCTEKWAGDGYLINLLVAAEACGLTSDEILKEVPDLYEHMDYLNSRADKKPGDYAKTRNNLAYNLIYMDAGQEKDGDGAYYAEILLGSGTGSSAGGWENKKELLKAVSSSSKKIYGKSDPDADELVTWLELLAKGYIPQSGALEAAE